MSEVVLPNSLGAVATDRTADLLASIISSFGTKPAKAPRGRAQKAIPRNAAPLPQAKAFNLLKTGYTTWVAQAKVVLLEEQTCRCCGSRVTAVKDELFLLSNTVSHSEWLRHEGYAIEEPENLPIRFEHLPPRSVGFCGTCASAPLDDAFVKLLSAQQSFPF